MELLYKPKSEHGVSIFCCGCHHLSGSPLLLTYLLLQVLALTDAISSPDGAEPTCSCFSLEVTKNNPGILNALLRSSLRKADL